MIWVTNDQTTKGRWRRWEAARDEGDQVRAHRCASRVETASLPPLIARRLECVVVRKTCGAWALLGERYDPLAYAAQLTQNPGGSRGRP
jgi:hypothetical protein